MQHVQLQYAVTLAAASLCMTLSLSSSAGSMPGLEFLLTRGRAVSLSQDNSVLSVGSEFELKAIQAALPGYEVRFSSAEEQENLNQGRGGEGTGENAFVISKSGIELLEIFGDGKKITFISGSNGVIDSSGIRQGSPLRSAYRGKTARCFYFEGVFCLSEQSDKISYVVGGGSGCDYDLGPWGQWANVETAKIPPCAIIAAIGVSGE